MLSFLCLSVFIYEWNEDDNSIYNIRVVVRILWENVKFLVWYLVGNKVFNIVVLLLYGISGKRWWGWNER